MAVEDKYNEYFKTFPKYGTYLAEDWKKEIVTIAINLCREKCAELLKIVAKKAETKTQKKSVHGKSRKWQNVKDNEEFDLFSFDMKVSVDKDSILNAVDLNEFIK